VLYQLSYLAKLAHASGRASLVCGK
jgi:hypothetical protein